jgi:NADP-dependent 3-hydroxy acid dehydrogenase YdfG
MPEIVTLEKKRVLVTGASSGIGRAIALAIGNSGGRVALCARRVDRLEKVAEEIRSSGGEAGVIAADFFEEQQIIDALAEASTRFGGLDILVNSAGIGRQATLMEGKTGDWIEMMNLNILALAIASREAIPYFPDGGGHIVNISSLSGHRVPGRGGFYSATKFAVRAMTEGLRQELRIAGNLTRVSSISPGFVETELLDDYFQSGNSGMTKEEAIQFPIMKPEDIAAIAIHQLTAPANVDITDVLVRPTQQAV